MIGLLVKLKKKATGSTHGAVCSGSPEDSSYNEAIAGAKLMVFVGIFFLLPSICLFIGLELSGGDSFILYPAMLCSPTAIFISLIRLLCCSMNWVKSYALILGGSSVRQDLLKIPRICFKKRCNLNKDESDDQANKNSVAV
ncbi:unnamed protein product [Calicophoron daubneyi]|uniref:Uncharacterized protein n=1 Tax=Calicophoron daubneyi TaxID=300641 RepID=A0AAV2TN06_CALDB